MPAYKDEKTGKWYCQFYYTDWQGNRKHTSKRGFARKKDAEEWEAKKRYEIAPKKISMENLFDQFLLHIQAKVKLGTIKESSYEIYEDFVAQHLPFFKNFDMEEVRTEHINQWILTMKPKRKGINKLAPSTLNTYRCKLNTIFNFAMKHYGLAKNPVRYSELAKEKRTNKRASLWSLEEYQIFYNSLDNEEFKVIYNLMFWAGLRIGEVLALKAESFYDSKVVVIQTMSKLRRGYTLTDPKTYSSRRIVAIPSFLYYQIMDYIDRIPYLKKDDLIFNYTRQHVYVKLNKQSDLLGLPRISPHILRHSYASLLLNLTKDPTVVAKQIGHSNPQITLSIYSHMLPGEDIKAANLLEKLAQSDKSEQDEIIDIEPLK